MGELRLEVIAACAPVVQDVVVTGHDRRGDRPARLPQPGRLPLALLRPERRRPLDELIRRPEVRGRLAAGLAAHNATNRANSRRIARALLLAEPPSIQSGEITDKGYVNQRAVLDRRAAIVERLYVSPDSEVLMI